MNEIKDYMISLVRQSQGTMRRNKVKQLLKALYADCGCSAGDLRMLWGKPESFLGPFCALPREFRDALSEAAFFHYQLTNLTISKLTIRLTHNPIVSLGGELSHYGWRLKVKAANDCFVGKCGLEKGPVCWGGIFLYRLGRLITKSLIYMGKKILAAYEKTPYFRAPILYIMWTVLGVDINEVGQAYVENIPIDPRLHPVYRRPKLNFETCGLIGFDLLPSGKKLFFAESNFNAGFGLYRLGVYPDGDPVCVNLVKYACTGGFRRIIFNPTSMYTIFPAELETSWKAIADKNGVNLDIVDDFRYRSPCRRGHNYLIDSDRNDTLYVNGRYIYGPLGNLICQKGLLEEEFYRFNENVLQERSIALPRKFRSNGEIHNYDTLSKYPNIIIKNAFVDMASGIELLKGKELPPYANSGGNIAYEFVKPDCIRRVSRKGAEEFVYLFRAYLLVTPRGPYYLGARKDISSVAVPDSLGDGKVQDPIPYITNLHLGDYPSCPTTEEESACREALMLYGEVIDGFLKEKHASWEV